MRVRSGYSKQLLFDRWSGQGSAFYSLCFTLLRNRTFAQPYWLYGNNPGLGALSGRGRRVHRRCRAVGSGRPAGAAHPVAMGTTGSGHWPCALCLVCLARQFQSRAERNPLGRRDIRLVVSWPPTGRAAVDHLAGFVGRGGRRLALQTQVLNPLPASLSSLQSRRTTSPPMWNIP
jgi:hypothetical protein